MNDWFRRGKGGISIIFISTMITVIESEPNIMFHFTHKSPVVASASKNSK